MVLSPPTSWGHTLLSFLSLLGLSFGPGGKDWVQCPHLFRRGPSRIAVGQTHFDTVCPSISQTLEPLHTLPCSREDISEENVVWRRGDTYPDGDRSPPPTHMSGPSLLFSLSPYPTRSGLHCTLPRTQPPSLCPRKNPCLDSAKTLFFVLPALGNFPAETV